MKFLAATALALTLITPATAQSLRPGALIIPPIELDYPHQGTLTIVRADRELLKVRCPKTSMPLTLGCSSRYNQYCTIHIANDEILNSAAGLGWSYEIILRHEVGHCNDAAGIWKDHKGARTVDAPRGKAPEPMPPPRAVEATPLPPIVTTVVPVPAPVPRFTTREEQLRTELDAFYQARFGPQTHK